MLNIYSNITIDITVMQLSCRILDTKYLDTKYLNTEQVHAASFVMHIGEVQLE